LMQRPELSFTTYRSFDIAKALIKSIQVLQDGGRWIV